MIMLTENMIRTLKDTGTENISKYNNVNNTRRITKMKRFIILMITVMSILGITPCVIAEGTPTIEFDGSAVTVTNAPDNATLIIAAYDNGILSGVKTVKGSGIITADVSQYLSNAERIKAFLWDMENIYPLVEPPKEIAKDEPAQSDSTIILNMNGTDVKADLYDNKAANAFKEMLPYTVTVSRAADDLCGSVSEILPSDPSEDQDTWSIGEIGWFDGWFTILCDNEEGMPKRTRTIIGKIHDEDIPFVQSLTGSVKITARLADSENTEAIVKMKVQIGDKAFTATLEDNAAVAELVEMMKEKPITINMNDYWGFEKVGPLGRSLTTSNVQTTTTAGDIVLYNGNQIVMFYGSNSWSYTRIGRIDDLTGWEDALGSGSVTVTFDIA